MTKADREWHDPERAERVEREDRRDVAGMLLYLLVTTVFGSATLASSKLRDPRTWLGRAGKADRAMAGAMGGLVIGLSTRALTTLATLESDQRLSHLRTTDTMDASVDATRAVDSSTASVRVALDVMSAETAKAQRLAIWVAIGTALAGAVVGGFAGAWAAQIVGG